MSVCYNRVIDVATIEDATTEPVTLEEVKRHLNMSFDTSGSYSFDDDDTYLTDLITQCREALERYTDCTLAPKILRAQLQNDRGGIYLPYGPIGEIVEILDKDGETIETDDYELRGIIFKELVSPGYADITYNAGYTTLPASLKRALLEEIAFRYAHRGEQQDMATQDQTDISEPVRRLAKPFKRSGWLL